MTARKRAECEARRLGVTLTVDKAGRWYSVYADCPTGRCFEPGLHVYTAATPPGFPVAEVWISLADDLACVPELEVCTPECDCTTEEIGQGRP